MHLRPPFTSLLRLVLLAVAVAFLHASSAQGAVTFRAAACNTETWSFATVRTLTVTKPAGTVTGDLMILTMYSSNGWNGGAGPPDGFTALLSSGSSFSAYKIATGGEPASYNVASGSFTSGKAGAIITTFTGVNPTNPFATAGANQTGSDASVEFPNTTASVAGSMRYSALTVDAARTSTYSGLTEAGDCAADAVGVSGGYEAVGAGATTSRTTTLSGTGSWVGQTYVVQPTIPPSISSISPSAGPTAGGTSVTITGSDFSGVSGASGVRFGATNASSYTVNSATSITATAPPGTGTQDVSVTGTYGTSANTAADDYTYYAPPTVTAVAPSVGPTAGGTSVTITGTNFAGLSGASAVTFGGTNAASYTVDSATQITATAPARAAGLADVRVSTPGGTSANTAADDYTYQSPPAVTAISPSSGPEAGGTSVTITGTNFSGLSGAAAVQFGGTNASSYTVNSATSITATAPAGTGTQDVRVTTPGGTSANTAADNYTYYAVPTITSIAPTSGPAAGGTSVTITGTNFAGLSGASAVQFGGTNAASYTVNSATSITATSPAGTGTQDVRVTTPGGTTANTAADDFTYIPLPTVTSLSPSGGPTAGGTTVTITGTGFTGATQVVFGATNATGYTVNSATSITATAPAGAGTQNVRVTTAGGQSANTAADDYIYYASPTVTSLSPTSGPEGGGTSVTITGTNFAGLSGASAVQFGGADAASYTVNSATSITATAPAGTGTQSVRVTTPGGTSANTAADDYTYVPAPTVTSLAPTAGPTAGGNTVTITGTNLTGATAVTFGGVNATGYSVVNATTITATAPAGAAGNADVRVTTPGGQSANTAADDYTYFAAPAISSMSPMSGPAPGGTSVTITGTNLTGATAVTFGGVNATGYSVVNATTITATAPAGTGTVDVRVTTPGGVTPNTAADDFTYVPAPTVTSLSPAAGPTAGGTSVTITGTTFTGATAVTFDGVAATGFSVVNGTTITATAPAHAAGSADVRVTTPSGTSPNTAADDYTYVAAPTVTGLSPTSGPTAGGTTVTITGTGFTGATQVTFGGTNASGYSIVNATTITATSPAHASGNADVRVTTAGGQSANTADDDYLYVDPPVVSSIAPASGPATGGTVVTITGSFLTGTTGVTFGGTPATGFTVVNATTITATAPAGAGVVDVRVTSPSGTSANTAADNFSYIAAPTVTGLAPTQGPDVGGTSVTVTGTNLTGATSVTFGGVSATGYSVVNATTITATAPAHVVGVVDVRVTTPGGVSPNTGADDFEYLAACGLGSLALSATDFSFTPLTLDGLDHTQSTTTDLVVSDMTGAGAGWKVEIGTSQFTAGPGKLLPADAARITSALATPQGGSCSSPTSSIGSYPVPLPLSPSKAKVYNAGVGTGLGPVDLELGVDLDIPANVAEGTYTSTWTIDLSAAP